MNWNRETSGSFASGMIYRTYDVTILFFVNGTTYYGQKGALTSPDVTPPMQPENVPFNFVSSVIRYKMYILENWDANNFTAIEEKLRSDEIESAYDLFNLVDELYRMESLYFKFGCGDAILIRQYDLLRQRILNFADAHAQSNATTMDQKRALSYIYTITLSKMCALKQTNANQRVYTDLPADFELEQKAINDMQRLKLRRI